MSNATVALKTNPGRTANRGAWRLAACFAVGTFAGALASFFPRLTAILAGDPTQKVQVFSGDYVIVGSIVAAVVGIVILIVDSAPERKVRDVFMTALGVPTLLMGALTTGATGGNLARLQSELTRASAALQSRAEVPTVSEGASTPVVGPLSLWTPLDLLIGPAHAQSGRVTRTVPAGQSSLGLSARQNSYFVVFGSAATEAELKVTERALNAKGIATRAVQGSKGDVLLVPADGAVKPYSEAVLSAAQARDAGAQSYLVPVTAK